MAGTDAAQAGTAGDFAGRVALVTGASQGIGRALACGLGGRGAHVVAVARDIAALEALDDAIRAAGGEPPTLVPLDLRDDAGLGRLAQAIGTRWGRLDCFVASAGILGPLTPVCDLEPDALATLLHVNLIANQRLVHRLDPLLRAAPAGRAILLSSSAAWRGRPFWGGYAMTKAALDALGRAWAAETAHTAVRVNLVNPGGTRTAMRAAAMPGEDPLTLPAPEDLVEPLLALLRPDFTETGHIYDFPTRTLQAFRAPA
ncbi:SDR family NAD(P)-dependent oxidoreductase [Pseudoxanthobacter sp.]|uniref:SDR family NAD(P)-dependent oxidoreductase n=1 Tax=Pseudoxanthobacter sp. TaxID=1925742 RepID=UPI002FE40814